MKVDIHVLGSTDGYRTIARSPGLRSDEEGMLTVLNFGQVESADMAMLEYTPVVHGRQLPSGRYALTRYVPGAPDDVGRPTIELRTIVMDMADFTGSVRSGLTGLVHDHAFWLGGSFMKGSAVSLPRHAGGGGGSPGMAAAVAGWQTARSTGAVALIDDGLNGTPAILDAVATIDPGHVSVLRWGVSILSLDIDVDLCTVLSGRRPTSHRPLHRIDLSAPPPVIQSAAPMGASGGWGDEIEPLSVASTPADDLPPGIASDPWEVAPSHEPKRTSGLGLPLMIIGGAAALVIIVVIGVVLVVLFGGGGSTPAPPVVAQSEPVETTPVVTPSGDKNPGTTNTGDSSQDSGASRSDGSRGNGGGGGSGSGGSGGTDNSDKIRESVKSLLAAVPGLAELKQKSSSELDEYRDDCSDAEKKLQKISPGNSSRTRLEEELERKRADLALAVTWVKEVDEMETAKGKYKFDPGTLQHKLYLLI
ncbi:MAG: hypothetical protein MK085_12200, partial [Phycisphaerales bacterium]|nr:hypothetical protein [Phycisphaerales bacterium]